MKVTGFYKFDASILFNYQQVVGIDAGMISAPGKVSR